MVIKLSPKIEKEVSTTTKDYGYGSEKEFIEDALRHRILELKKAEFLVRAKKIREKMRKKGFTEKEVLKDFEKFSHKK